MSEIDDDFVSAFPSEQRLAENELASPDDERSLVSVWAFDEEESGEWRPAKTPASQADNDNWLSGFLSEEPLHDNPVPALSKDFSPEWVFDQLEADIKAVPAAIESSTPMSLPLAVASDRWIAPAVLTSQRRTSLLVPAGTAIVLAAMLVAYVGVRVIPRASVIEWSRLALSKVVKPPPSASTLVTEAAPVQPIADRHTMTSPRDGRGAAERPRIATASEKPSVRVSSSKRASSQPPSLPLRSSPPRKAAVPIWTRAEAAIADRPAPVNITRTADATKGTDLTPGSERSAAVPAGLSSSIATSPTATAGVAPAPSPAASLPESPTVPSAAPAASISAPAVTTTSPTRMSVATSEAAVRSALGRYVNAYRRLDVGEAKAIWPSVDAKALGRAFAGLESQSIYFNDCQVSVDAVTAKAHCVGTAEFVPKVGNRTAHLESREWTFEMKRTGEQWTITHLDVH